MTASLSQTNSFGRSRCQAVGGDLILKVAAETDKDIRDAIGMACRVAHAIIRPVHNPFDQLAKKVGKEALAVSGPTIVQYEISRDAQHADLGHDPDPGREAERARLGLLGRIAAVLCLIDVFAHALDGAELRAAMSKHFAHWEECARKERALNKRRKDRGLPPEPFVEPLLWIIAAAVSAPMLRSHRPWCLADLHCDEKP